MTTYQGIAAVTQGLNFMVGNAVRAAVPEATVTLNPPEAQPASARDVPRLNIYMVQVTPDPTLRSAGLPMRDGNGQVVSAPQVAVNLRYLLSFFGPSLKAQLMLGAAQVVLREHAVLDPTTIQQAVANHPELTGSGLDLQVPPVRFAPSTITLEELSRFWSGFFQVSYTLSTLYEASPVILTSTMPQIADGLPVLTVTVEASSLGGQLDPFPVVTYAAGGTVPVSGRNVVAGQFLHIAGSWVPIESAPGGGLSAQLPPAVQAGTTLVQLGALPTETVSTSAASPSPPVPSIVPGSRPQPLVIRPVVTGGRFDASNRQVSLDAQPQVGPQQQVWLTLVGLDAGGASARVGPAQADAPGALTFTVPALPTGAYLAIAEVDGVSSLPTTVAGRYAQPQVQLG